MSKFWVIVTVLFIAGVLVNLPSGGDINFTDLETECQYERESSSDVKLEDRRLNFDGFFPVENPDTDLSYSYSAGDKRITLDVDASGQTPIQDFFNNCRAVAVYDAETGEIDPGRYIVTVNHDGREEYKSIIRVK